MFGLKLNVQNETDDKNFEKATEESKRIKLVKNGNNIQKKIKQQVCKRPMTIFKTYYKL